MCRKPFNQDRVKKLIVDKVDGDGAGLAGPMMEEYKLFRRIATFYSETTGPEDINAVKHDVDQWIGQHARRDLSVSEHHPLNSALAGLIGYLALQREKAQVKEEMARLRRAHERHVAVKDKDSAVSALVEQQLVQAVTQKEEEADRLRREIKHLKAELRRYTHPGNPLPRPPELNPAVSSILRYTATKPSLPPNGVQASAAAAAPAEGSSQDVERTARATSLRFVEPVRAQGERSRYRVTSTGEQLRQESRQRPHLIIPGAPTSDKVLPEEFLNTPRPQSGPIPSLSMWAGDDWPYDYPDPRPVPGEPVWFPGPPEDIPPGVANVCVYQGPSVPPVTGEVDVPTVPATTHARSTAGTAGPSVPAGALSPPVVPSASVPHMSRSSRLPVDSALQPMVGHSPMGWRSGPGPGEDRALVWHPTLGMRWFEKDRVQQLPRRRMGTQSDSAYVVTTEPEDVDREPGQRRVSPGPNPLQLIGVPVNATAGPSSRVVPPENPLLSTAIEGSALLGLHPDTTARPAIGTSFNDEARASSSLRPGPSGLHSSMREDGGEMFANHLGFEPMQSVTTRPVVQNHVTESQVPEPSPAPSWGTVSTEPASLSLGIANLPINPRAVDSMEQLGLTNFSDDFVDFGFVAGHSPDSFASRGGRASTAPSVARSSEGSSRQVVTGLQDLTELNRSLTQVAQLSQSDRRSTRSAAPSRHSRQSSISGHEGVTIFGPRTGLALYGSGPATQSPSRRPSAEPSPVNRTSLDRAASRASASSRAESTGSHRSSVSSAGMQRSISERPPRAAATPAISLHGSRDIPSGGSWISSPSDTQPYASRGQRAESRLRGSQESIPRSLAAVDGIGGISGSLMLSFEAPNTSTAVDREGREAAGIQAPRPVSSRRSSNFFTVTFNRSSDR
ncbi:hypothetical protein BN946_scf184806.g15 [Trametes cinnabarina]|uniref:Uncharacterized protein n=1 Tax=Pycnoporus cinnabarinus TaxID=5643 RepID=A0A060SCH0_PYCCI|nr:hypothetical protein BN946_scf184806.g15 [Trametes cinnabarina]